MGAKRLGIVLILIMSLAGCFVWDIGVLSHSVYITSETVNDSSSTFHIEGKVSVGVGEQGRRSFSNISVVLYNTDYEPVKRIPIGTLNTGDNLTKQFNATVNTSLPPAYIVIESPDFWDQLNVSELNVRGRYLNCSTGRYETYAELPEEKFPRNHRVSRSCVRRHDNDVRALWEKAKGS